MIKKLFRKNGIILLNNDDDECMKYNYFFINNYIKIQKENMKIEYYKKLSFNYSY